MMVENPAFRIRSFVRRNSRQTPAQRNAYETWSEKFVLPMAAMSFPVIFGREVKTFLEIGFGNGQTLLAASAAHPEYNFIGIDVHTPGIGNVLLGIQKLSLQNLRIVEGDVIDLFKLAITDASLAGIQIFFPDPWPKRKHHIRRLIQPQFLNLLAQKLEPHGSLHIATDWEDYARHIQSVLFSFTGFENNNGPQQFSERSPFRPIISKFEQHALTAGRQIWDLQLTKIG